MAHAREPIATAVSLVGAALTCFVIAKATWLMLLLAIVVFCFGCCLYKLIDKTDKPGKRARPALDSI
ncbi:MAG: hypothetical protein IPP97_20135 [Candidatus Obscuribacter sp.]|jgi:hypothetical protein|nr:hypothetical protein [Candidatus Obscuribacter sp.]MBL0188045.1 hypothetical protein [Candidatus Obscuribacter sp.]MBP6350139.1 hypothetical protein [Candidatus Obscuribacter sp.]MDQ5968279.1 hypothetical protein [Cyanobacteriota bacterium erpe_2018_sw_39hr_WHONDRS-SW48-000098_B_bin.30]